MDGIFILAPLRGEVADRIRGINEKFDPKLARSKPPHITITGSSGVGPIPPTISPGQLRAALEPVVSTTEPIELKLGAAERFLATDIIILPIDPYGPIRVFHDRIASSGLPFLQARFTFTPHITLSLYPTLLPPEKVRELLKVTIEEPVTIDTIEVYHTRDPQPARKLLEFKLGKQGEND